MASFNIADAKAHLSSLVQRALMGEEVIISRDNKPLLRLTPLRQPGQPRVPGSAKGRVWMASDFDATPEDFQEYL